MLVSLHGLRNGFLGTLSVPFLFPPTLNPLVVGSLMGVVGKCYWMKHPATFTPQCMGFCVPFVTPASSSPPEMYSAQG